MPEQNYSIAHIQEKLAFISIGKCAKATGLSRQSIYNVVNSAPDSREELPMDLTTKVVGKPRQYKAANGIGTRALTLLTRYLKQMGL